MNASASADVHLVQMWVLPDTDGIEPSYEQRDLNDALAGGGLVAVASGQGHDGAVSIHQRDAALFVGRLDAGEAVARPRRSARARVRRRSATRSSTAPRSRPATPRASPTPAPPGARRGRRRAPRCWSGRRRERERAGYPGEERAPNGAGVSVVAVDWSGRRTGEAPPPLDGRGADGELLAPRGGPHPGAGGRRARRRASAGGEPVVAGFDFSFSLPEWFLDERGYGDAADLWAAAAADGERWLRECPAAVLGPAGPSATRPAREQLRRTEADSRRGRRDPPEVDVPDRRGRAASAPVRSAASRSWPASAPPGSRSGRSTSRRSPPVAVEIYPRTFTGAVVKSRRRRAARVPRRTLSRTSRRAAATHAVGERGRVRRRGVGARDVAPRGRAPVAPRRSTIRDVRREGWVWEPGVG